MKPTIQQKIAVLKRARRVLRRHNPPRGICWALFIATEHKPDLRPAYKALTGYISLALSGHAYLEPWLRSKGVDIYAPDTDPEKRRRLKATRLAWVDWMIQCYEEDLAKQKGGGS